MALGATFNSNISRNELISLAFRDLGVLAEGETLGAALLADAIFKLNMLTRQQDMEGKLLTVVSATPSTLTLVANTFSYTSSNGLPTNIYRLETVSYRNAQAQDTPCKILTQAEYETIVDKISTGDPAAVFLSAHTTIGSQTLLVSPMLAEVNTQSVVTGSDNGRWKCIKSHVATTTEKPITGANYLLYWESGGTGPSTWAADTSYTAPQHLRLWFRRPVWDFDTATDNPDLPQAMARWLLYALELDLGPAHGLSIQELQWLRSMRDDAWRQLFPGLVAKTTEYHNKSLFYSLILLLLGAA